MHYFSRGPAFTAFQNRLLQGPYAQSVTFHQGLDRVKTHSVLCEILANPQHNSKVYMCGPGPFMDTAEAIALENWPADAVRLERFAANPALAGAPTQAFEIELARSGIKLKVGANETILEVLEAHNIDAAFSCEQRVCGTCVTEIMQGTADHRDSFLSQKQKEANTRMCLCVSRAKSTNIVLDL